MAITIKNRITEHLAIKARREGRSKITQDEIMEATNLSRQTVSTHINNKVKRYDVRVIEIWCEFLGITPDQFFTSVKATDESDDIEAELRTSLLATA